MTKSTTAPYLAGASTEDSLSEAAAAAGIEATGGGGTGQSMKRGTTSAPEPETGISSADLAQAGASIDALMLAALRALAAPSDALVGLRAAVAGGHDLAVAATRHRRPEPTVAPVALLWDPDSDLAAAAVAALTREDSP